MKKGISLVALTVTVIVLLILLTVTISLVIGNDGIIGIANDTIFKDKVTVLMQELATYVEKDKAKTSISWETRDLIDVLIDDLDYENKIKEVLPNIPEDMVNKVYIEDDTLKFVNLTEQQARCILEMELVKISTDTVSVTTNGTTVPANGTVTNGTALEVNFNAEFTDGTIISINPQTPYTTNGVEKTVVFTITGTYQGIPVTKTEVVTLADKYEPVGIAKSISNIAIGDYINYDAGRWTPNEIQELKDAGLYDRDNITGSLPKEETPFMFGGFKAGASRNVCVSAYGVNSVSYGWVVIGKNVDGTVKIMHAGTPEGFFHPFSNMNYAYKTQYILGGVINSSGESAWQYDDLPKRSWKMYENDNAVENSAHILTYEEANSLSQEQRTTSSYYWLPLAYNSNSEYCVINSGLIYGSNFSRCFGIRPTVTLKADVKIAGYAGDSTHVSPDTAWEIVD